MGFMHRVKVMLGLADDYDEYEDEYYDEDDDGDDYTPSRTTTVTSPYAAEPASVRRVTREPDVARARDAAPVLRAVPASGPAPAAAPPQVRIHTVEPRSYAEAQTIADKFKSGQPVIINLSTTDQEAAKRLLDFAAGLTYGLEGGLQKVSDKVFMLSPANVDVSAAGSVRPRDTGMFPTE